MTNIGFRSVAAAAVVGLSMLAGGCATTNGAGDPLEGMNRAFYNFNDALDRAIMVPVSEAYVEVTPSPVRGAITNFFDHLAYPGVIINDILQGKILQGFEDTGRFLVNSVFGIAGLADFATDMGLERHDEDFGQTLCVWGMDEGAYLVIPFLGPSSLRDVPDKVVSGFTSVQYFADVGVSVPLTATEIVSDSANLLDERRIRDETALDPYVFTREAYRQKRTHLCYDGNPPLEEYEDFGDEAQ